ncbi:ABC transporter ATP-binding protein [Nocardia terpenica]|uniref:ABC transporter ATP-binding protein n=1 Tax=Nocardia terpenica TaxID=455432 RepID=UPI0018949379|nr:ABC transporter ATP-binding protein [Nocardia terpenica]MBF6065951.1 ABC transporter ATP-binding protein [Nocardia terpenica]MBF6108853.1 ABC transporter ATP-binding protein [Nocardia terpenica]MBF6116195.1 ABC transporter ATP-binding protein [Nocardia terpenica]MBF6123196.1 ABC transporter ATP-binding protein [Nocardia terpenica]MBF6153122.1 ABC transporter ATP-binding protein [Nocardia terpenica]
MRSVPKSVGVPEAVGRGIGAAVRLNRLERVYGTGDGVVAALRGVTLDLPRQALTVVMGPSGSGKSTLLHCAAGLDKPSAGTVHLGDRDLTGMSEAELTVLRREQIGFVFQSFNLIPSLTAAQNVALPLRLAGTKVERGRVEQALDLVGLGDRAGRLPAELSGGQQQRVALARALITRPQVIFGDEPTGALDTANARRVLELLRRSVDEWTQTVIMVTHDPVAASFADSVVFLADGLVADIITRPTAELVAKRMTELERVR